MGPGEAELSAIPDATESVQFLESQIKIALGRLLKDEEPTLHSLWHLGLGVFCMKQSAGKRAGGNGSCGTCLEKNR